MSPTARFDVAVIGAGPAGAAAALGAASAGLSVALFEPQVRPDKPCGEGILPSGVRVLHELGLGAWLARGCTLARIRYVLASGREIEVALDPPGCALERPLLAEAFERALEGEPRIALLRRRVTSERSDAGFLLRDAGESWSARTLIAADGLQGRAAEWLRRPGAPARRYGLRARALGLRALERVEVHLGRASEVYLTPLAGGRVNVAVLRDGLPEDGRASADWLAAALREHPGAAEQLGEWVTPPEARALSRARPRRAAEAGAFLAGDAAGGIDPVLGCGVALALTTGLAAARAAARVLARGSGAPERDYRRFVRRETRARAAIAGALVFLAAHPRLQDGVARVLRGWPRGTQRLARLVAGA